MGSRKGTRGERWVANQLEDEHGMYAQRTTTSGGATDRARPDVIALESGTGSTRTVRSYAIEVKYYDSGVGRLDKSEIEQLNAVSERSGAVPIVVMRPNLRKHDHAHSFLPGQLAVNDKTLSVRSEMLPGTPLSNLSELHQLYWSAADVAGFDTD